MAKKNKTDISKLVETESDKRMIERRKHEKSGFEQGIGMGPKIAIAVVVLVITVLLCFKFFNFKNEFVVKFDTDGGTEISSQTIKKNEKVEAPDDPAKEGYEFLGWYLGDKEYDFDSKVTKDITIKAKWENLNTAEVTGITLDQREMALLPNENVPLVATVEPEDARNKNVKWKSSDEEVAEVDDAGFITSKKLGVTTITATTEEGDFSAKCTVVVSNDVVKVTGVSLNEESMVLGIGDSKKLSATVTPTNATNTGVTWETDDKNIASVSGLGVVPGVSKGKTVITVRTKDGAYTAKVNVEVKKIDLKKIVLDESKINIGLGETKTISYKLKPDNSTAELVWKSANDKIVSVDKKGKITGLKEGSTTIIATSKKDSNISASVTVKVTKPVPVTGISLDKHSITLYVGGTSKLTATVTPTNATEDKNFKWSNSNSSVATIKSGKITALNPGTTTIKVTSNSGNFTDTCTVTVKEKPIEYTYKTACTDNECSLTIYENGKNITSSVSGITVSGIQASGSDSIKITKDQKDNLPDSIGFEYNNESKSAKRG